MHPLLEPPQQSMLSCWLHKQPSL